mgnify:CR=1 FL=1
MAWRQSCGCPGGHLDTLLSYDADGTPVRLEAAGAPPLAVRPPFSAQTTWAVLADGGLAIWTPGDSGVRRADRGAAAIPTGPRLPVDDADREHWLATAIPQEFMGRRVFDPLRDEARRSLAFPDSFPPVLALEPDPSGGLWIRKSTAGGGEVWHARAADGSAAGAIALPPGRRLLAVGPGAVAAAAIDEQGVERVEIYERSDAMERP